MPRAVSSRAAGAETAGAPAPARAGGAAPGPRFRFRNIGPVKDAELELGDLTILAGRNNTGKTYLAYTLYGFLKKWRKRLWAEEVIVRAVRSGYSAEEVSAVPAPEPLGMLSRAAIEGAGRWEVSPEELQQHRRAVLGVVAEEFSTEDLPSVFSAPPADFADSSCSVIVADEAPRSLPELPFSSPGGGSWRFRYDGTAATLERLRPPISADPTLEYLLAQAWLVFSFPELAVDPITLTAERLAISIFYRELDFTRNQLVDRLQRMSDYQVMEEMSPYSVIDQRSSRYTMPIRDNIDYTRSLPDRVTHKSPLPGGRLYNHIRDMMGGYYLVADDGAIRMRSRARKEGRFDIPIHLASGAARDLSDFYFFLKHTARQQQVLVVDEPEAHLDVENQIALARLLSRLVRAGLRVLITTHSDYVLKELNNLMMLHCAGEDYRDSGDLDYSPDDALDPGRVRAYIADSGRLSRCVIDDYGMNMPFFDKTIQKINRASHALTTRVRVRGGRP